MKFLLLLLSLFSLRAQAQDAEALVKAVRAKMDAVRDYTATGRMIIDVSFIKAPPSPVTVYYKNPDRFRIRRNGGISILPKGGVSVSVNSLMFGGSYAAVDAGAARWAGTAVRVVKLLPLQEGGDVVLTTLYIDPAALLIRRAAITTRDNGSYEMELAYGKYARYGLPDEVIFAFNTTDYKLPKGITFEYEKGNAPAKAPAGPKKGRIRLLYSAYTINQGVSDKVFSGS